MTPADKPPIQSPGLGVAMVVVTNIALFFSPWVFAIIGGGAGEVAKW